MVQVHQVDRLILTLRKKSGKPGPFQVTDRPLCVILERLFKSFKVAFLICLKEETSMKDF